MLSKLHWFNYVFFLITVLMIVGGGYAVYVAHMRPSGGAGIDAGQLTQMRVERQGGSG